MHKRPIIATQPLGTECLLWIQSREAVRTHRIGNEEKNLMTRGLRALGLLHSSTSKTGLCREENEEEEDDDDDENDEPEDGTSEGYSE